MTTPPDTLPGSARYEHALKIVLTLTSIYLAVETVGGLLTHSLALLADAAHMLTDVAALGLSLMAIRIGRRPATAAHSYGYYRVEILAAVVNGVALLAVSAFILFEAWQRLLNPPAIATRGMLLVAVVGLGVNIAGARLLRRGSGDSLNVRGAYLELLSDLVSSIGVILAALIIMLTGWRPADALLSAGIGVFIIPRTWRLLRDAGGVLLEGTPADIDLEHIRTALIAVEGVADIHDLHVWSLTSGFNALSAHVVRHGSAQDDDDLLTRIHDRIRADLPISHATIQIEAEGRCESETPL